jgi:GTP-binding protein
VSSESHRGTPVVALVGRPNVGKSTLFNRIVGGKTAIVHDRPGVTRDRHYGDFTIDGRRFALIDTGGFDPGSDDPMRKGIKRQIDLAIDEADVVVCVLDAAEAPTATDHAELRLLRESGKPVIYVGNKADGPGVELEAAELYRLGMEKLIPVSALHNRRIDELLDAIAAAAPPAIELTEEEIAAEAQETGLRVAIVGKPNAGKSSLVNRLLGEERMLVDDRPGTTRDPIDSVVERDGKRYVFIDTAGIRRRAKVRKESDYVEAVSVIQAMRAMERCDVVLLLCDAAEGVAEQDAKILGLAVDRGRAIVVGLNKTDQMDKQALAKAEEDARDKLSFIPWAPVVRLSVKNNRGVGQLVETVTRVAEGFRKRVTTGELNRFFEQVLANRPPPTHNGRAPRIYYVTQAEVGPPLFVVQSNHPEQIHFSYQRYVINQIRKSFGFEGVPVKVRYKPRRRREDTNDTKAAAGAKLAKDGKRPPGEARRKRATVKRKPGTPKRKATNKDG